METQQQAPLVITNHYGEAMSIKPELGEMLKQIPGISQYKALDSVIKLLIEETHHGAIFNASGSLTADLRWDGWKTIKTWLKAGSTVVYLRGESLDILLVDHNHKFGFDAYKGYTMLGGGYKRMGMAELLEKSKAEKTFPTE